jgi:phenylacetate-CoA ligase
MSMLQVYFDAMETQPPADRAQRLFDRLPEVLATACKHAPAIARQLQGLDTEQLNSRDRLAQIPVFRKNQLLQAQHAAHIEPSDGSAEAERKRIFGGLSTIGWEGARRVFASPGPIYEPESARPDYWGFARALHAAGIRPGPLVHNCFSYEGLAEFDRPVELTAAWGKKRCGHRLKGWKIRVSNHELDARP